MASDQLFDISGFDLDATAVTADDVGRMNPQAGDMRQLDRVVWYDEEGGRILGVKQVRHDEFWVPLHIPGRPLFPGVLMIEAAAQLCSVFHQLRTHDDNFLGFTRCDETVFRGQVVPGDTLYLLVEGLQFNPRRFVCRAQGIVNGALRFETKVTGMVLPERQTAAKR